MVEEHKKINSYLAQPEESGRGTLASLLTAIVIAAVVATVIIYFNPYIGG